MNTVLRNIVILRTAIMRKIVRPLFCLTFMAFITINLFGVEASSECARKAYTLRNASLMDQPPSYSTKSGWVYGNKVATIPKESLVLICESREIGFFGSKQIWLRITWDTKYGWINGAEVEERKGKQASLLNLLGEFLSPTAYAQADSATDSVEGNKPRDPIFIGSFISMVAGMIAKSLFDLFRRKRPWLGSKDFAIRSVPSLVISPIIFLGFLRTADISFSGDSSVMIFFLFAFQSGFFWEDVLNIQYMAKARPFAKKKSSLEAV